MGSNLLGGGCYPLRQKWPIKLAVNGKTEIRTAQRYPWYLLVTVKKGEFWLFIEPANETEDLPDFIFAQKGQPIPIEMPGGEYRFTVVAADSKTAEGVIHAIEKAM